MHEIDAQVLRLEENIAFQIQMLAKLDQGGLRPATNYLALNTPVEETCCLS
jgi:hypothetical protein